MDETKYYVFYDGDCGFCNQTVQWILNKDRKDQFLFAPLQGEFGQKFLYERGLSKDDLNTLYLWKPKEFYLMRSQAVFQIAKLLGGTSTFLSYLRVFPSGLTDFFYNQISRRRKQIPVKNCELPSPTDQKKFLA